MKQENSFLKILWKAGKKDILFSIPWLPVYSLSEIILALSAGSILQLVFVTTPRIQISELIPGNFKDYIHIHQVIDRRDLIFIIPIFIIIAALIKLISGFMSSYLTERAGHKIAHSLREEMLKGFLSSPGNILDQKNPDETANQLMQDTALLQGAVSKGTISAARDFVVLIGIIISMLIISWKTFFIGILIVAPMAYSLRKIAQKLNYYTREGQKKQIGISTRILSTHNGLLTINALRSHNREKSDFENLNNKNYYFMKKSLFVRTFFSPGMEFFATFILAIIFSWRLSFAENFQSSTYSSMLILLAFSFKYIKNIAGTITFFSEIKVVLYRVKNFIGDYSRTSHYKRPSPLPSHSKEAVIAHNVTYKTENGKTILENCSLKIEKGKKIAFIGESGAGKTTFLRSIAGLIIPNSGEISLTADFLLASQSPYIFRGTVKENIIYAEQGIPEHISDDKAKELVLALMLSFSENGSQLILDKKLGFLGDGLSGGEKARVALARTLFASPKLILLDEPTANLDSNSANLFWQAIHKWKAKDSEHTVIAVSHSLNEVKDFDFCYVFENGVITKQGTPQEILNYV